MRSTLRSSLASALLLPLLTCAGDTDEPAGPQRTDSAGVEIVTNPGTDRTLAWSFQEELRIGGDEEGPGSFYQVWDELVTAGAGGTIYVMDRGNHRLKAFDDLGRHLWSAGREGQGPGEFRFPAAVAADADGGVAVVDYGRRSVIRYSPRGDLIEERPMEGVGFFGAEVARPLAGVEVISRRDQLPEESLERRTLRYLAGSDTVTLQSYEGALPEMVRVDACGSSLAMRLGPFFTPDVHWATRDDRVVSAWGWADYRVDVHRGGELVRSIRRGGERPPVDEEAIRADNPEGFSISVGGSEPCELDLDELMEKRGYADVVPAVADLALSPSGELWVERQVPGPDHPIDVFDARGAYLGTLPPETPYPAAFLPDGRVVTVEENELEVPTVVIYRVDRGVDPAATS